MSKDKTLALTQIFDKIVALREGEEKKLIEALEALPSGETPHLILLLRKQKAQKREDYNKEVQGTMSQVDHHLSFGGGLSKGMEDSYDSDVRSAAIGLAEEERRIDWLIGAIEDFKKRGG